MLHWSNNNYLKLMKLKYIRFKYCFDELHTLYLLTVVGKKFKFLLFLFYVFVSYICDTFYVYEKLRCNTKEIVIVKRNLDFLQTTVKR